MTAQFSFEISSTRWDIFHSKVDKIAAYIWWKLFKFTVKRPFLFFRDKIKRFSSPVLFCYENNSGSSNWSSHLS